MARLYMALFVGDLEVDGKGYYRVEIDLQPEGSIWVMPHGITYNQVNSDWGVVNGVRLYEHRSDPVPWETGTIPPVNFYAGSEVMIRPGTLRVDANGVYVPMFSIARHAVRKERIPHAMFDEHRVYLP